MEADNKKTKRVDLDDILGSNPGKLGELIRMADEEAPVTPDADAIREGVRGRLTWKLDASGNRVAPRQDLSVNVQAVLDGDPDFAGMFWYDSFSNVNRFGSGDLADTDSTYIRQRIFNLYGFEPKKMLVDEIIDAISAQNRENPLLNYLNSVKWDGNSRLGQYLIMGCGAEDLDINKLISKKWLIQCVARAFNPGCKADTVLVLVGQQGIKKSTALKILGGEWFSDTPFDIGSRHAYMQVAKAWIYELAEVEVLRRSENTAAKAFLSSAEDTFVPPYGRRPVTIKRHTVFCGTTNRREFLTDPTGNRRYWPVDCVSGVDLDWIKNHRDQLWAEAVYAFHAGESWWMQDQSTIDELNEMSSAFRESDPWEPIIQSWSIKKWAGFSMDECMREALKMEPKDMPRFSARVADLLSAMGFIKVKVPNGPRVWKRPGSVSEMREKKASGSERET